MKKIILIVALIATVASAKDLLKLNQAKDLACRFLRIIDLETLETISTISELDAMHNVFFDIKENGKKFISSGGLVFKYNSVTTEDYMNFQLDDEDGTYFNLKRNETTYSAFLVQSKYKNAYAGYCIPMNIGE